MERILLIDDDQYIRDSLTLTLETAGYSVSEASNTKEGLKHHRKAPASVVITDVITMGEWWERSHTEASPAITDHSHHCYFRHGSFQ